MARSRSIANALAQLLDSTALPIFALDPQRRVVFGNQSFCQLAEIEATQLVGQRCDYGGDAADLISQVAQSICPPPEVTRGGRGTGRLCWQRSSGEIVERNIEFIPLVGDGSEPCGVLGLLTVASDDAEAHLHPIERTAQQLHHRLQQLRPHVVSGISTYPLLGESPAQRRLREQVKLLRGQAAHVLIVGPPGSSRQRVARLVHYQDSARDVGPLVPVPCAIVDSEMLQNTVTGFVRQMREIESRRPGALLLLDVDQLSPPAQSELAGLLALPDFELFTICTSRQSLLDLAAQGQFQFELACRLSTVVLHMTPLAERPEDIPLLAQFFVEQYNAEGGSQRAGFTEEAVDRLVAYDWPENVEELAEIVGQACRRADGPRVGSEDLPELIHLAARLTSRPPAQIETIQLDAFLQQIECELLSRALQAAKGNKSKAADLLGISRARLHRRLEQLGIS